VQEPTANSNIAGEATREIPVVSSPSRGHVPATTTVPTRDDSGAEVVTPRRVGGLSRNGVLNFLGAVAFALSVSTLLFGRLALFSGPIGFVVVAYLSFLVSYAILVRLSEDGPAVRSAVMTVLITSAAVVAFLALAAVVLFTLFKGWSALRHLNFFTQDLSSAGPTAKLSVGGVKHALVGTLWMISIALLLTVPVGITSAVYLNEARGKMPRLVRTVVDAMTAFPSVLAGLFVFATWILLFGFEKSGLAAALALSVEMLPIVIRGSDVVLRLVPGNLREASVSLGSPIWRTAWHVVLPTARPGLVTCVILATARGIGETAPVLLTAGYTTYLNNSPLHGPMVSLPLVTFQLVRSGQPLYIARGFGAALFLLFVVLFLFALARAVGGRGPGNLSARQLRRAMRLSSRDIDRFIAAQSEQQQPQLASGV
jgi:phosphate transport system permease protein